MRGTALLLVLMLTAAPVTAQEITGREATQPPARSSVETPPPAESSDLEVPESLKETLRLLRTPGLHPELMEVFGLDAETSLAFAVTDSAQDESEDEGMPLWAKLTIIGAIVGTLVIFLAIAFFHS